jgi:hypothetical protein
VKNLLSKQLITSEHKLHGLLSSLLLSVEGVPYHFLIEDTNHGSFIYHKLEAQEGGSSEQMLTKESISE